MRSLLSSEWPPPTETKRSPCHLHCAPRGGGVGRQQPFHSAAFAQPGRIEWEDSDSSWPRPASARPAAANTAAWISSATPNLRRFRNQELRAPVPPADDGEAVSPLPAGRRVELERTEEGRRAEAPGRGERIVGEEF